MDLFLQATPQQDATLKATTNNHVYILTKGGLSNQLIFYFNLVFDIYPLRCFSRRG